MIFSLPSLQTIGRLGLQVALGALLFTHAPAAAENLTTHSLREALTATGTLRPGVQGSFNTAGFELHLDAAGRPQFRPAGLRSVLGAGDANWSTAFSNNGPNGPTSSLVIDAQGNLYVGGAFTKVGTVAANYVAKWNGTTWSALGTGLEYNVLVMVLDASGNLYVGGGFTTAGGMSANRVARWNGSAWSALGSGLGPNTVSDATSDVTALALDGRGNLYAGGDFRVSGSTSVRRIARWNGSTWSALGDGMNDGVRALTTDAANNLYVGGYFTDAGGVAANHVAKWSGTAWSTLGDGTNDTVQALALDGSGSLYVAGSFTTAGSSTATGVARWNGNTWSTLGSGLAGGVVFTYARALALDGTGNLFVGGGFTSAGGVAANNIARWDGKAWNALGTGTNANSAVYVARATSTGCYIGGTFTAVGDNSQFMTRVGFYTTPRLATTPARASQPLTVFPNPAHSAVDVQLPANWPASATSLTLTDALGRVVRRQALALPATGAAPVSLTGLAPGRYLLQVQAADQLATAAVLVE